MKKVILLVFLMFNTSFGFFLFEESNAKYYNFQSGKNYYYLTISAKDVKKNEIKSYTQSGMMFVEIKSEKLTYSQAFTLPIDADADSIEATLQDDLLTFKIKKLDEKKAAKNEIKIK